VAAKQDWLKLNEQDSVLVALADLPAGTAVGDGLTVSETIPRGHKVARRAIAVGEPVMKFGIPIGIATRPIAAGTHIHTHNLEFQTMRVNWRLGGSAPAPKPANRSVGFEGFRREDGRVGTRNYLGVLTTVNCSATVARLIAERFRREIDLSQHRRHRLPDASPGLRCPR
jgi:altronate hydrolase